MTKNYILFNDKKPCIDAAYPGDSFKPMYLIFEVGFESTMNNEYILNHLSREWGMIYE